LEIQRLRQDMDARSVPIEELCPSNAQGRKLPDILASEYTRKGGNYIPAQQRLPRPNDVGR
jgi:hypothetical protein